MVDYKAVLRICFSLVLLVWLLSRANPQSVLEISLQLSFLTWITGVFFFTFICVLAATRWFVISRALDFPGQWFTYVGYYFIGQYFNLFLPTSIGGDIFKILFISRGERKKIIATYSVMADRFFGLAAMLLMGAGALLSNPQNMLPRKFEWILYLCSMGIVGFFVFLPSAYRLIKRIWPNIGEDKRITILLTIWRCPSTILKAVGLSLVLNSTLVIILIMLAAGIGITLPAAYYFAIFPLTAIVTILPVSFNGIGLREGAFVYLLSLRDVPMDQALTLSLCLFAVQCSGGLAGGIAYGFGLHKKRID